MDHATGLLMAMPEYHSTPLNPSTEETREAEQVEAVHAALFEKQLLGNDFWPRIARDLLIYDRAFLKAMTNETAWTTQEGYPVRGKRERATEGTAGDFFFQELYWGSFTRTVVLPQEVFLYLVFRLRQEQVLF